MKLCLGTVQFGMDYGIQGANRQPYHQIDEVIREAINSGIKQFDSASAYGEAEAVLGHYIKHGLPGSDNIKVVSKLAAGVFDNQPTERWGEIAQNNAKQSIESLGVDKLEAYLFHNAARLYDRDAVMALLTVKECGLTNKVGVSVYTPEEAMKALDYDCIEAIQIPYNIFDHRLDRIGFFDIASQRDVTIYARSTLLQGLIMMEALELPENMRFASDYLKDFRRMCEKYRISPLQAAVGYVDKHEGIDYVVFGVDSIEQLREYIEMQESDIPDSMIQDINQRFDEVEERLVNPTLWGE